MSPYPTVVMTVVVKDAHDVRINLPSICIKGLAPVLAPRQPIHKFLDLFGTRSKDFEKPNQTCGHVEDGNEGEYHCGGLAHARGYAEVVHQVARYQ
jgi:hypothetical protein